MVDFCLVLDNLSNKPNFGLYLLSDWLGLLTITCKFGFLGYSLIGSGSRTFL